MPEHNELLVQQSDSIWGHGENDPLNNLNSSIETTERVVKQVNTIGKLEGLFVGFRMLIDQDEPRSPLLVFEKNPYRLNLPFTQYPAIAIGPLSKSEAIAAGYLIETAVTAQHILDEISELEEVHPNSAFKNLVTKHDGNPRFVPLGVITLLNEISELAAVRDAGGLSPEETIIINELLGSSALFEPFVKDGNTFGKHFENWVVKSLSKKTDLYVPFAGIDTQPKSMGDWELLRIGMVTGIKLFREIEGKFS